MPDLAYDVEYTVTSGLIPPAQAAPLVAAVNLQAESLEAFGVTTIADNTTVVPEGIARTLRMVLDEDAQQSMATPQQRNAFLVNLYRCAIPGGSWTKLANVSVTPVP